MGAFNTSIDMNQSQNSFSVYLRLLKYLKGLTLPFIVSIFGYLIFAASQPMLAKLMELIVEAIETKDSQARIILPLLAVAIVAARGLGSFIGDYFNEYVGANVIMRLKLELFEHLNVLPAAFYDTSPQGPLLHRLNNGVSRVQSTVTTALKTQIREGLTVIALLGYAFYLNWQLSLVFLALAPILGTLVSRTGKKFRQISRKSEGAAGQALQVSKELMENYQVVKSFGAQDYEASRYESVVNRVFRTQLKIKKVSSIFTPLSQLIVASALALTIFLILTPDILAHNTAGELIGYLTTVGLIPKPMRQLSRIAIVVQRGIVGAEMIFDLLDREPEEDNGSFTPKILSGSIQIKDLDFKYPRSKNYALKNINLTIHPGEMIALVGKSGSGKSTLASLLYRQYKIPSEKIYIDDVDINDFKLASLRSHISVVDQNISLFNDTIRNNISYGDTKHGDSEIIEAATKAQAIGFIQEQPNKLDTQIGENGNKLSGGQQQRLSIARAFLKPSPILILDEATSALDSESETAITKAVETLAKSRTTIVIAHRLSTVMSADRVLVLDQGSIVESGTHKELLNSKGPYYKLFTSGMNEQTF